MLTPLREFFFDGILGGAGIYFLVQGIRVFNKKGSAVSKHLTAGLNFIACGVFIGMFLREIF